MSKFKTWADFAKNYDLVLFNYAGEHSDVIEEYYEQHQCEAHHAADHLIECDAEDCKTFEEYREEYGDEPQCQCEVFQWYAIAAGEWDVEYLNKTYSMDIFWSDTLGIYILPVYHFGTAWDHVDLNPID